MGSHRENPRLHPQHLAEILARMPDLWRSALGQHTPDPAGWCLECRDTAGTAARWPCLAHRIAAEARDISESRC